MRLAPFCLLAAALATAACTDSQGRIDYAGTALLGAGIGAAIALVASADSSPPRRSAPGYGHGGGYRQSGSGYRGTNYGYGK